MLSCIITDKNQERITFSYSELKKLNKSFEEEYKGEENDNSNEALTAICNKLPGYIQQNGLLKTVAFLKSNAEKEIHNAGIKRSIYSVLSDWLMERYLENEKEDLLNYLLDKNNIGNLNLYMVLTKEAIEFTGWLRRHQKMM